MPKFLNLEKNYIDPLAALLMLQGSNLVHLSMFIGITFVRFGDDMKSSIYNNISLERFKFTKSLGVVDTVSASDLESCGTLIEEY